MIQEGKLTKPQKAAAVLVAMGKPSAGRLLRFFKHEELKALIAAARELRTIPQSELERIVAEFEGEFTEGAGLLDSGDQMDTILSESLSPEEMSALMGWGKPALMGDETAPIWPELENMDPDRLGALLADEHPQTIAMVFTNLTSEAAAKAVVTFAKPIRADIIKRMLSIRTVQPAAQHLVENQLRQRLIAQNSSDVSAGQERVAGLLNELDKDQVDELMADLQAAGAKGIDAVKARLFAFDDIVLLSQKARVTLFDGLSTEIVTTALRGAPPELAEAALSAIGARSRRMVESELSVASDAVTTDEIMRARKRIAATAIGLAATGVIELPAMQDAA